MPSLDRSILLLVVALHLAIIWAFEYFPSQDGPVHLYNAQLLLRSFEPSDVMHEYFRVNTEPDLTWFGHLAISGLLLVFPPLVAEKVLLSCHLLVFVLGARYALKGIRTDAEFLTILFVPFAFNYTLHMGFYSFSLSIGVALWTLGYWFRYGNTLSWRTVGGLGSLLLLLYWFTPNFLVHGLSGHSNLACMAQRGATLELLSKRGMDTLPARSR